VALSLVPARRLDPEWMDRPGNTPDELNGALDDIRSVNRYLRGSRVLVDAVRPHLIATPQDAPLTVLDVGTGGADLPLDLVAHARRMGRGIRIVGVDRDAATLDYARARTTGVPEIELCRADAFALPFAPLSFDLVTASLFLHHFAEGDAAGLLSGFRRIARTAVLINDLERHIVPWAVIGLLARLTRRHAMFVHDAPLSVLRGFTREELLAVAHAAGSHDADVALRVPYRLLLTMPGEGGAA
jgi:ubiquinone/menaquinone biosynthesis C-methylase UbiE